eukprot:TRINITY_DN8487_c0_g1_i1.p1 TRINITY_DN8487_c0_g1~~TRINITY_DN8487_c0_g1_i1.p1  ORF type:complete len:850 (+),score=232.40 TRINITY_DN8487_c0_g1_i1:73-2550(+)
MNNRQVGARDGHDEPEEEGEGVLSTLLQLLGALASSSSSPSSSIEEIVSHLQSDDKDTVMKGLKECAFKGQDDEDEVALVRAGVLKSVVAAWKTFQHDMDVVGGAVATLGVLTVNPLNKRQAAREGAFPLMVDAFKRITDRKSLGRTAATTLSLCVQKENLIDMIRAGMPAAMLSRFKELAEDLPLPTGDTDDDENAENEDQSLSCFVKMIPCLAIMVDTEIHLEHFANEELIDMMMTIMNTQRSREKIIVTLTHILTGLMDEDLTKSILLQRDIIPFAVAELEKNLHSKAAIKRSIILVRRLAKDASTCPKLPWIEILDKFVQITQNWSLAKAVGIRILSCLEVLHHHPELVSGEVASSVITLFEKILWAYAGNENVQAGSLILAMRISATCRLSNEFLQSKVPGLAVTAMNVHVTENVQDEAVSFLALLGLKARNIPRLVECGLVPATVAFIRKNKTNLMLMTKGIALATALAENDDVEREFVRFGLISDVLHTLEHHSKDDEIQKIGVICLKHLTVQPEHKRVAMKANVPSMLVSMVGRFALMPLFLSEAFATMRSLARDDEAEAALIKMGAVSMIVQALQTHISEHPIIKSGVGALEYLCTTKKSPEAFKEADAIPLLVEIIKIEKHMPTETTGQILAIFSKISQNDECEHEMVTHGAGSHMMKLISNYSIVHLIPLLRGLQGLGNLMFTDAHRRRLAEEGILVFLMDLLGKFSDHLEVVSLCCRVLQKCPEDDDLANEILEKGVHQRMLSLMETNAMQLPIIVPGVAFFVSLVKDADRMKRIADPNLLPKIRALASPFEEEGPLRRLLALLRVIELRDPI